MTARSAGRARRQRDLRSAIASFVPKSILRAMGVRKAKLDWDSLFQHDANAWNEAKRAAENGPRVLLAPSMGGFDIGALTESVLAVALTLRGAQAEMLLCDGFLPACQLTEFAQVAPPELRAGRQPRCQSCEPSGRKIVDPLGLPILWYSDFVTEEQKAEARHIAATADLDDLQALTLDGLAVGEHALAGALRYFARGTIDSEPERESIARMYLEAAMLSIYAIRGALERGAYDVACFNHGIYVPQGLLGEVCRREGVRVVTWNPAYRRGCFIFSHSDSYHHTMISESASEWEKLDWKPDLEHETLSYLKSRWRGTEDWISFHERPVEEIEEIGREVGVDFERPCIALLTSVIWDAQLHYESNAFPDMVDWVLRTIDYFARRPEIDLAIRVHPAERTGSVPSRQPIAAEIERRFPTLPSNVHVIGADSHVSTYALVQNCNAAIIYNTKTGIEIASMGIPVIVAGEAWIRNKGFSLDASSPEQYFAILDRLPLAAPLDDHVLTRARKYAFHFFFRRMIPVPFLRKTKQHSFAVELSSFEELREGSFPGLDVICDGILQGTPFVYRSEGEP